MTHTEQSKKLKLCETFDGIWLIMVNKWQRKSSDFSSIQDLAVNTLDFQIAFCEEIQLFQLNLVNERWIS